METYDWNAIVDGLNRYLHLRSIPIGMKLFETVEEMEAIPKIRRPRPSTPPIRSWHRRASSAGRWASPWPTSSARSAAP